MTTGGTRKLAKGRKGTVHAVKQRPVGLTFVCGKGVGTLDEATTWMGELADVTCAGCRKWLRLASTSPWGEVLRAQCLDCYRTFKLTYPDRAVPYHRDKARACPGGGQYANVQYRSDTTDLSQSGNVVP